MSCLIIIWPVKNSSLHFNSNSDKIAITFVLLDDETTFFFFLKKRDIAVIVIEFYVNI